MAPVTVPGVGPVMVPVPPHPPARRDSGTGRIANYPARDQTKRAANESTCQGAERTVTEPFLSAYGGREEQWQCEQSGK